MSLVASVLSAAWQMFRLAAASSIKALLSPSCLRLCAQQSASLGFKCLGPVVLILAPVGAMFALQAYALVHAFDIERILPIGIAPVLIREIAPGFTCFTLAMLACTSIAAEIASMKTNREIEATLAMGIDPRAVVVGTRVLSLVILAPLLNVVALFSAAGGSYFIAVTVKQIPSETFWVGLFQNLRVYDVVFSELKCMVLGLLLGAICTYFGYNAQGNINGIRRAINWSVNLSVATVFSSNYFINLALC
jgi:phospholipid/cholesterol/gamma-HCH transport system permease protein